MEGGDLFDYIGGRDPSSLVNFVHDVLSDGSPRVEAEVRTTEQTRAPHFRSAEAAIVISAVVLAAAAVARRARSTACPQPHAELV